MEPGKIKNYSHRIYHLKGNPFEIGYATGQALGKRLDAIIARYIQLRLQPEMHLDQEMWKSGALPWLHSLPDRFLQEFVGLAQGSGLPLQRLAEWAHLEVCLSDQCSGAICILNDRSWVARNNDFFAPELWGYVTIREVTGRIPAISFCMEGDVFTPTGINQEKLWLHYNYLPVLDAPQPDWPHLPGYAFLVEALETCRTLQDVEDLLGNIQRDDGMLLFALDGKTDEFALYECTCTQVYKREPSGGWLVGTNHYCTIPQVKPLSNADPLNTINRYQRVEQLVQALCARGPVTEPVNELIRILADDYVESREGETVTVYSTVACPSAGEIWYTFGGYPAASQGNWRRLEWPW
jgi:hypothetical protein